MKAKMLFKVSAAAFVLCAVVITGLIAYHVWVDSLGRVFERLVPARNQVSAVNVASDVVVEKSVPALDPGEQFYEGARDHVSAGKFDEAKKKLGVIIANHPRSGRAPEARRVLGEINLDELFSGTMTVGKVVHCVRPGETYADIAEIYRSDLDCLLHINSVMDPIKTRVGQNLVVLPLDFHFVLEVERKVVSIWSGESHVCEFPVLQLVERVSRQGGKTVISSKVVGSVEERLAVGSSAYRSSTKAVWLAKPVLKIMGWDGSGEPQDGAVLIGAADMEELFLLMRPGNEVDIR
jgi:hypothetical protein